MNMKGVHVLNAQFLLTFQHILRFVGCNYGHVKATDEGQSFSAQNTAGVNTIGEGIFKIQLKTHALKSARNLSECSQL